MSTLMKESHEKDSGKKRISECTTSDAPNTSNLQSQPVKQKKMMSRRPIIITLVIAAILFIAGLAVGICWPAIYNGIIADQLSLSKSSINFGFWKETPIPIYLKLHMFNMKNPEEFSKANAKPEFEELGPYVFRQVDYKVNRVWNDNNHTITFQRKRIWHFDESLSKGSLSDKITNLNPVAASVAYQLRYTGKFFRDTVNRIMLSLGHKLVVTKTAGELLFDGYNDTMLLIAKKFRLSKMPYTKFGWFYGRNGSDTYDGTFNMDTGTENLLELGMVREWNYSNRTESYKGECGVITGSNGELWPPLPNNDTIPIFVTDICTDLKLKFENETNIEGIEGSKYHADHTLLDNGQHVPERKCYCEDVECVPSGALNVSLCKYDAPIFVSLPHFYLADPSYLESVSGLEPSKEKHDMEVVIQPDTGIPIKVKAQLQLNLLIQPDAEMSLFRNVTRNFIPMMWFTQEAALTSDFASQVKFLIILRSLGTVTFFGIAGIGVILAFIGIFLFVRRRWQGEENQVLLTQDGDATRIN